MNDAVSIAENVLSGKVSAVDITQAALTRIADRNDELNCFTTITAETALRDAAHIDQEIAAGENPGVLAGVPFAVKNLFVNFSNFVGFVIGNSRENLIIMLDVKKRIFLFQEVGNICL